MNTDTNLNEKITRTLFRVQSISCFYLVLLAESVSFIAILSYVHIVSTPVYSICTHTLYLLNRLNKLAISLISILDTLAPIR